VLDEPSAIDARPADLRWCGAGNAEKRRPAALHDRISCAPIFQTLLPPGQAASSTAEAFGTIF
jgi:hypothetical protein